MSTEMASAIFMEPTNAKSTKESGIFGCISKLFLFQPEQHLVSVLHYYGTPKDLTFFCNLDIFFQAQPKF